MIKTCDCGGALVNLTSMNKRICSDCKKEYEWNLDEGQKPLISSNRGDRFPHVDSFCEQRIDVIASNGNDGEHYMCGDRWLETGSPWR